VLYSQYKVAEIMERVCWIWTVDWWRRDEQKR